MRLAEEKIKTQKDLVPVLKRLKAADKTVVFTNGCFDLLHRGHVRYLQGARSCGDVLVVAINSDESVRALKGEGRPIVSQDERAEVLAALECVDFVTVFEDATPLQTIQRLLPDVLVKGGDWALNDIVGREAVENAGGRVIRADFVGGSSTTDLLNRIRKTLRGKTG